MSEVPTNVDHLAYVASDLDRGMREIERRLGVRPAPGGRHPDYGTRNALLALGPTTYLEIVAPDPELAVPERGRLFGVDGSQRPRLATWALRSEGIEDMARRARSRGVDLGPVWSGSREKPDGTVLSWRLTDPYLMPLGGVVPFLIAWDDTPHPAGSAPDAGELVRLVIRHPEPDAVREALGALGVEMAVREGPRPRLEATIRTASGSVTLR